jgi:hypothetical protein
MLRGIPNAVWIDGHGFNGDGERFNASHLIDRTGRCVATVDHPLADEMMYAVCLRGGWADNKYVAGEDAWFLDLHPAKRYCEEYAAALARRSIVSKNPKAKKR